MKLTLWKKVWFSVAMTTVSWWLECNILIMIIAEPWMTQAWIAHVYLCADLFSIINTTALHNLCWVNWQMRNCIFRELTLSYGWILNFGRVGVPNHNVVQRSTVLLFVPHITVWKNPLVNNKWPHGVMAKGLFWTDWSRLESQLSHFFWDLGKEILIPLVTHSSSLKWSQQDP